jgi:hypothetical protein
MSSLGHNAAARPDFIYGAEIMPHYTEMMPPRGQMIRRWCSTLFLSFLLRAVQPLLHHCVVDLHIYQVYEDTELACDVGHVCVGATGCEKKHIFCGLTVWIQSKYIVKHYFCFELKESDGV